MEEANKFEGFYKPEEKTALTKDQADKVQKLEKVAWVNGHYEDYIGGLGLHILNREGSSPKIITRPSALLSFVKETAKENGLSPWEVTQAIRSWGVDDPEKLAEIQKRYKETITYVGDVHGGNQELFDRLKELQENPPEYLIFNGDIMGTENFARLQFLFYEYLNNHSKNVLGTDPEISDQELLDSTGSNKNEEIFSLKSGFIKVREFELELAGKSKDEIKEVINSLTDEKIADEIRRYSKYAHYGHYASNLPEAAKKNLAHGLEENAQKLVDLLLPLMSKGSQVIMLQGNWDARSPVDFVPGEEKAIPLPENERLFSPRKFFEERGIKFFDKMTTIETKTTLQILFPFDSLVNFPNMSREKRQQLIEKVKKAREENKGIIAVGHGEPNFEIHNLHKPDNKSTGEHALVVKGFTEALSIILPDEIVYGHMHFPLNDKDSAEMDINTKYALALDNEGVPSLIENTSKFDKDSMLASYVPLGRIAEIQVPRFAKNKKIDGVGGQRQPAKVN
jgi:hypothetical protein